MTMMDKYISLKNHFKTKADCHLHHFPNLNYHLHSLQHYFLRNISFVNCFPRIFTLNSFFYFVQSNPNKMNTSDALY